MPVRFELLRYPACELYPSKSFDLEFQPSFRILRDRSNTDAVCNLRPPGDVMFMLDDMSISFILRVSFDFTPYPLSVPFRVTRALGNLTRHCSGWWVL